MQTRIRYLANPACQPTMQSSNYHRLRILLGNLDLVEPHSSLSFQQRNLLILQALKRAIVIQVLSCHLVVMPAQARAIALKYRHAANP